MLKINGKVLIQRDEVGEAPTMGTKQLVDAHCNKFLLSRGLPVERKFNYYPFPHKARR